VRVYLQMPHEARSDNGGCVMPSGAASPRRTLQSHHHGCARSATLRFGIRGESPLQVVRRLAANPKGRRRLYCTHDGGLPIGAQAIGLLAGHCGTASVSAILCPPTPTATGTSGPDATIRGSTCAGQIRVRGRGPELDEGLFSACIERAGGSNRFARPQAGLRAVIHSCQLVGEGCSARWTRSASRQGKSVICAPKSGSSAESTAASQTRPRQLPVICNEGGRAAVEPVPLKGTRVSSYGEFGMATPVLMIVDGDALSGRALSAAGRRPDARAAASTRSCSRSRASGISSKPMSWPRCCPTGFPRSSST
jgi:hypothetical protein